MRFARAGLGAVGGVVALAVLIAVVDRQASTLLHAAFGEPGRGETAKRVFIGLTHIVDLAVAASVCGTLIFGGAILAGRTLAGRAREVLAGCLATLVAIAQKDELKLAFGRLWPETWVNNPSWIGNGAFGFSPFHGGVGWSSFPSGHMASVTAPCVVIMLARPAWRGAAALPILLVAAGLLGADYHFVSDVVAGAAVGTGAAVVVWRVVMANASPSPRA